MSKKLSQNQKLDVIIGNQGTMMAALTILTTPGKSPFDKDTKYPVVYPDNPGPGAPTVKPVDCSDFVLDEGESYAPFIHQFMELAKSADPKDGAKGLVENIKANMEKAGSFPPPIKRFMERWPRYFI